MKILLIEDDITLAETVKSRLSRLHSIDVTHTGTLGLQYAGRESGKAYDIILLDITLPDSDGISVCQRIRSQNITTPVLMLTAEQSARSKVVALDSGADDYLTKPFNFDELQARIRAVSRRPAQTLTENIMKIGDLIIDPIRYRVEYRGKEITLRRKEFVLLEYLARHHGQVVTRQMILDHVWDSSADPASNTVDVHINHLRGKIGRPFQTKIIKTIPGVGYKLEVEK